MRAVQGGQERGLRSSAPEHTSSTSDVLPTPESPSTRMRTFSAVCRPSAITRRAAVAAGELSFTRVCRLKFGGEDGRAYRAARSVAGRILRKPGPTATIRGELRWARPRRARRARRGTRSTSPKRCRAQALPHPP